MHLESLGLVTILMNITIVVATQIDMVHASNQKWRSMQGGGGGGEGKVKAGCQ